MGFEISDSGESLDPPSKIYLMSLYREGQGDLTMAINGCVISGPDPGAVPGASTSEVERKPQLLGFSTFVAGAK
jgi:hypothetical protein